MLSWLFIISAGFTVLVSGLQNVLVNTMMPGDVPPPPADQPMPAFVRFMFSNIRLFFFSFLVLALLTLISAVGLLKRRNWARLVFVGLFGLGIAWNVAVVVLQQSFVSAMAPAGAPPMPADFGRASRYMLALSAVSSLAASLLCAWLIMKLMSAKVRAEFSQAT